MTHQCLICGTDIVTNGQKAPATCASCAERPPAIHPNWVAQGEKEREAHKRTGVG